MYVADFHIHSRYSRATSREMDLDSLPAWAQRKGIHLVGTGDFSHDLWYHTLRERLEPTGRHGIYSCRGTDFILTTEVCLLFEKANRLHRIHLLIFVPTIEGAGRLNRVLERYGSLESDGRPMLHLPAEDLVRAVEECDDGAFVVPAHIWTPHFSLFGSNSGFDAIEDCFGPFTDRIFCLETGLSSDPEMNWRLSALDRFSLISNSDAHSPNRLGREANIFVEPFDFNELRHILSHKDTSRFLMTIEYFPEEGKYHYDGHRTCGVRLSPEESRQRGGLCPSCGRRVTVGVLHRVADLADRPAGFHPAGAVPFRRVVPLDQILASALGKAAETHAVTGRYAEITSTLGTELDILLNVPEHTLRSRLENPVADAIIRMRNGQVTVLPGYDGVFGEVSLGPASSEDAGEQTLF